MATMPSTRNVETRGWAMPRYDYRCATCEVTYEVQRPMAEADDLTTCPDGHVGATRLLPVFTSSIGSAPAPTAAPSGGGGCCGGGCCS